MMLKNVGIFAKSNNFEGMFNHLYVDHLCDKSEIKFQGLLSGEVRLKNARIFAKSDDF